jgi:hypothetical protein
MSSSKAEQHQKVLKQHSDANIDEYLYTSTFKDEVAEVRIASQHL